MSVEILSLSQTRGNNDAPQDTTVGGAKPLHRFINAQPQLIGVRHHTVTPLTVTASNEQTIMASTTVCDCFGSSTYILHLIQGSSSPVLGILF